MKYIKYSLPLLVLFFSSAQLYGQSIGLSSLFRPGVRVGAEYLPSTSKQAPFSLGSRQASLGLIVPLNGGASLELKKLKAKAFQNFFLCNAGVRQLESHLFDNNPEIYNFSMGVSGARFGVGSGLIAYSANIGMIQPLDRDAGKASVFGVLGAMKIRIRGLGTQDFYGFGLVYANNRVLPVPLVGIRRKLAKNLHATILLPAQADLTFSAKGGHNFSLNATWAGLNSNLNLPLTNAEWRLQVTQFKAGAIANIKCNKNLSLLLDAGMNLYQKFIISPKDDNSLIQGLEASPKPSPYMRVSLRVNMGKSLVNSQLFGSDS